MAEHKTLNDAMVAKDYLGEAELRYELIAATFEDMPQMRPQLNTQLERVKDDIIRLRALASKDEATTSSDSGKVVAIDANRFRKSG